MIICEWNSYFTATVCAVFLDYIWKRKEITLDLEHVETALSSLSPQDSVCQSYYSRASVRATVRVELFGIICQAICSRLTSPALEWKSPIDLFHSLPTFWQRLYSLCVLKFLQLLLSSIDNGCNKFRFYLFKRCFVRTVVWLLKKFLLKKIQLRIGMYPKSIDLLFPFIHVGWRHVRTDWLGLNRVLWVRISVHFTVQTQVF